MQHLYVASAVFLIFAVQQGFAIKCFVCNSHKDSNCAMDVPPEGLIKDCSLFPGRDRRVPSTYCRKITQVIEFSVNNLPPDSRIIRTCGFENQTSYNYCYQRAGFGGRQVVCSCDADQCNNTATLQLTSTAMITAALFAIFSIFFKRI